MVRCPTCNYNILLNEGDDVELVISETLAKDGSEKTKVIDHPADVPKNKITQDERDAWDHLYASLRGSIH